MHQKFCRKQDGLSLQCTLPRPLKISEITGREGRGTPDGSQVGKAGCFSSVVSLFALPVSAIDLAEEGTPSKGLR